VEIGVRHEKQKEIASVEIDIILESSSSPDEIAELGSLAESCGLRAVWVSNMLDARDPFVNLSVLARSTDRIRLGPIAVSPFELHPLKMASALLTLNELSGGRTCIVIGGGGGTMWAMGLKAERMVRAVRECVEILKQASKGERLEYEGEVFQVKGYNPFWAESSPPLIYIGANKETMFRMSTQYADGIMVSDFTPPMLNEALPLIRDGLASAGKSMDNFRLNNFWAWHVKESMDEAVKEARQWLAVRGGLTRPYIDPILSKEDADFVAANVRKFFEAMNKDTHVIEGVPDRILDTLVEELTCTGTIAELDRQIEKLQALKEAGLNEIALRIYRDPASSIRLIGEKVAPALI